MKKIINFILALVMCASLTSCVTAAQAQVVEEIGTTDVSLVIRYGTPYYNESGLLLYYIYRNLYYYPYYYNGWRFVYYNRPLMRGHYTPLPRDFYRHRPNPSMHHRPNPTINHRPPMNHNRGGGNIRPNVGGHRPSASMGTRPQAPRSSTRTTVGNARHGHGR